MGWPGCFQSSLVGSTGFVFRAHFWLLSVLTWPSSWQNCSWCPSFLHVAALLTHRCLGSLCFASPHSSLFLHSCCRPPSCYRVFPVFIGSLCVQCVRLGHLPLASLCVLITVWLCTAEPPHPPPLLHQSPRAISSCIPYAKHRVAATCSEPVVLVLLVFVTGRAPCFHGVHRATHHDSP
jgi:hypothetical protein